MMQLRQQLDALQMKYDEVTKHEAAPPEPVMTVPAPLPIVPPAPVVAAPAPAENLMMPVPTQGFWSRMWSGIKAIFGA